jgi:hypothetical protein
MHFFHVEPTAKPTREHRWALVSVANLESYQVSGTLITTCSTSWMTVFSWSRRTSLVFGRDEQDGIGLALANSRELTNFRRISAK